MTTPSPELELDAAAPLRCLVIDDDPHSVQIVCSCIANIPFLEASSECNSTIAAAEMLRTQAFDVLFLDVEMPLMSGLDLLRTLPDPPQVVLITSRQPYAGQAFELAVAGYLLKPLSYARFLQAAQKVLGNIQVQRAATSDDPDLQTAGSSPDFAFVKVDSKLVRVDFTDVYYVGGAGRLRAPRHGARQAHRVH